MGLRIRFFSVYEVVCMLQERRRNVCSHFTGCAVYAVYKVTQLMTFFTFTL